MLLETKVTLTSTVAMLALANIISQTVPPVQFHLLTIKTRGKTLENMDYLSFLCSHLSVNQYQY